MRKIILTLAGAVILCSHATQSTLAQGRPASCVRDSGEAIRNEYFRVRSKLIMAGFDPQKSEAVAMKFYEVAVELRPAASRRRATTRPTWGNSPREGRQCPALLRVVPIVFENRMAIRVAPSCALRTTNMAGQAQQPCRQARGRGEGPRRL
jgi:hypothetical protein